LRCLCASLSGNSIFPLDDLPEKSKVYIEINESYVDGGKFQPEKYQKASS